jgi:hypothetical protein
MTVRLMTPVELDNAVYELIVRELGVGNAMRFIAQNHQGRGTDYTRERKDILPLDSKTMARLRAESRRTIAEMKVSQKIRTKTGNGHSQKSKRGKGQADLEK